MRGSLKRSLGLAVLSALLATCPSLAQPTPAGPETVVNSYLPDDQHMASVAIAADGGYLVVWTSGPNLLRGGTGQDGSGAGVFGRRFDAGGEPLGAELQIDQTTAGDQDSPAVAGNSDGFVVVWRSQASEDEPGRIFARRFDPAGLPLTDPFRVSAQPVSLDPDVSCSPRGSCVVVRESHFAIRSVYVRRLPAGTRTGTGAPPEFRAWIAPFDTYSIIAPRVSSRGARSSRSRTASPHPPTRNWPWRWMPREPSW